jgi:hypothetical protein
VFVQQTGGEALFSDPDVTQAGSVHTSMMCTVSTFGSIDVRSKNGRALSKPMGWCTKSQKTFDGRRIRFPGRPSTRTEGITKRVSSWR